MGESAHAYLLDFSHDALRSGAADLRSLAQARNGGDLLPNGIFVREIAACQCLANDHCPWRVLRVALIEVATFPERNPHGAKVAGLTSL